MYGGCKARLRRIVGPGIYGAGMESISWKDARARAHAFRRRLDPVALSPEEAVGSIMAEPLRAAADMPAYDLAMADGWAISGPGPWRIRKASRRDIFSGLEYHEPTADKHLRDGQAAPVAIGEPLGPGVTAVAPAHRGVIDGDLLRLTAEGRASNYLNPGSGVRSRGSDAGLGTMLMKAGDRVTPAVAALAAAAGNDSIMVIPSPRVGLIRVGDESLDRGIPRAGLIRDSVSPALPGWIAGLRGSALPSRWVTEGDGELIEVIDDIVSDVVVTAGPFSGAAVRRVLTGMKADILVDGVACQPGASMLLAQLQDGRPLIHCGGVPADAIATLVTLVSPIIAALTDQPDPLTRGRIDDAYLGDRQTTFLLPVRYSNDRGQSVTHIRPGGPGGLFALSQADGLAIVPPGGVRPSQHVDTLPMP